MNDLVFTFLAVFAVCVTLIVLFRGHREALTTADRDLINELRERVRVLEKIVTDGGWNTAAQIEGSVVGTFGAILAPPTSGRPGTT